MLLGHQPLARSRRSKVAGRRVHEPDASASMEPGPLRTLYAATADVGALPLWARGVRLHPFRARVARDPNIFSTDPTVGAFGQRLRENIPSGAIQAPLLIATSAGRRCCSGSPAEPSPGQLSCYPRRMAEGLDGVREYYQTRGESEWHRLAAPFDGGVEWELHRRALAEWLPPRSRVLDAGGGPGRWAIWLAQCGHRVVLGDLSPVQLGIARREIAAAGVTVEDAVELDARDLSQFADGSFDAVLSMGPFYHLLESADRERAAAEACRVLRPGGRLFATVMTRYAWLLAVVFEWGSRRLGDTRHLLDSGIYRNEERGRFTDGYFHRPQDVPALFEAAGFVSRLLMASQGFLSLVQEQVAELLERDQAA